MKTEKINGLIRITAGEGMRITKGDGEYLLVVDLAAGASEEGYYEVPEAEYLAIEEEKRRKIEEELAGL